MTNPLSVSIILASHLLVVNSPPIVRDKQTTGVSDLSEDIVLHAVQKRETIFRNVCPKGRTRVGDKCIELTKFDDEDEDPKRTSDSSASSFTPEGTIEGQNVKPAGAMNINDKPLSSQIEPKSDKRDARPVVTDSPLVSMTSRLDLSGTALKIAASRPTATGTKSDPRESNHIGGITTPFSDKFMTKGLGQINKSADTMDTDGSLVVIPIPKPAITTVLNTSGDESVIPLQTEPKFDIRDLSSVATDTTTPSPTPTVTSIDTASTVVVSRPTTLGIINKVKDSNHIARTDSTWPQNAVNTVSTESNLPVMNPKPPVLLQPKFVVKESIIPTELTLPVTDRTQTALHSKTSATSPRNVLKDVSSTPPVTVTEPSPTLPVPKPVVREPSPIMAESTIPTESTLPVTDRTSTTIYSKTTATSSREVLKDVASIPPPTALDNILLIILKGLCIILSYIIVDWLVKKL